MTPNELRALIQSSTSGGVLRLNVAALGDPRFTTQIDAVFGTNVLEIRLTRTPAVLGAVVRIRGSLSIFGLTRGEYDITLNALTPAVQLSFDGEVPPSSLADVIVALTDARFPAPEVVRFTTERVNVRLSVSGREAVFSVTSRGGVFDRIEIEARRGSELLEYVAVLHVGPAGRFSSFLPVLAPLDAFVPRDLTVVLASIPSAIDRMRNIRLPRGVGTLEMGALLIGELPLEGELLALLRRLLAIETMPVRLSLGPVVVPDVELQSRELPDIELLPGLMTISRAMIVIRPLTPPGVAVEGIVRVHGLNLPLLRGSFAIAAGRVTVEVATAEPWPNPFGIPRLVVRNLAVQGEIIPSAAITIAGSIALSTRDANKQMSAAVRFQGGVPTMLAGAFDEAITILDVIETFFGSTGVPDVFSIVQFRDVALSVVPPPLPVTIGGETFDVGFFLKGTVVVAGLSGRCSIRVDPITGFEAHAELSRIDLLGLIVISGPSAGGGPTLTLRDRRSPFLELAADVDVLGLRQAVVAEVRADGFRFDLRNNLGIVDAALSCTFENGAGSAEGSVHFGFSADVGPIHVPGTNISMGTIHIGETGFEGRLRIAIRGGAVEAMLGGSFSLLGLTFTVPEFGLDGDLRTLEDLLRLLIAEIQRNAAQIFAAILSNADRWIEFLVAGVVAIAEGVAKVLFEVFHKSAEIVAVTLKELGKTAEDIVRELSTIGVRPEGAVMVLVQIGELPIDIARGIVENVLGVQIPHVDFHADHHFDIHADEHLDIPIHIDVPHVDFGHADIHFDF
ncbi:MAG TPA: hypothetical protein VE974_29025 [Thermoanaerobaculia bacterium]|nr:hypothetical protein [Thermoanaerobaculia bacterium]